MHTVPDHPVQGIRTPADLPDLLDPANTQIARDRNVGGARGAPFRLQPPLYSGNLADLFVEVNRDADDRPSSAMARLIDCRIHHVAYVENL